MNLGADMGDRPAAIKRPLRIVLFSGGTACRSINIALCKHPAELTRIVPAWDSGGSSKVLRETFGMLPVGDVRQALMTMAHGEGRAGDVVKICNARLSDHLGAAEIRAEFEHYASGAHPLLQRMEPDLHSIILNYINLFKARAPADFDLRNGSIGNFILTGAYFAHGQSIDAAILAFRELCSIAGNVWPASRQNDVQLGALLKNGRELARQHQVTRLEGADAEAGIEHIRLYRQQPGLSHMDTLTRSSATTPPPLSLPHKGEGDAASPSCAESGSRSAADSADASLPPPCGGGLRVGVNPYALTLRQQEASSAVEADPAALEAVENADLIAFGPGSFYTSILPHLHVRGLGEALARKDTAPRIFIGNILSCAETGNATLGDLVETFEGTARERFGLGEPLLTHVLSNRELFPFEKTVGKFRYLPLGGLDVYCARMGIAHISGDFEDAWTRGQHDGEEIARALLDIAATDQAVTGHDA